MTTTHDLKVIDLTQRPPRSPRCRLGGFAILPRLLDKCRAHVAGCQGDYHFNCPLDQQFFQFSGIDAVALREEVALGRCDSEMLDWIMARVSALQPWEIEQWTHYQSQRGPLPHSELFDYFVETSRKLSMERRDITTWFDLLDLDDYCSFGGQA